MAALALSWPFSLAASDEYNDSDRAAILEPINNANAAVASGNPDDSLAIQVPDLPGDESVADRGRAFVSDRHSSSKPGEVC